MQLTNIQTPDALLEVANAARRNLAEGTVDRELLSNLYASYNEIDEVDLFVDRALTSFPSFACGVASLYLKHLTGEGEVVQGSYSGTNHSFYRSPCGRIVDITADQFGGPPIYVGFIKTPWSAISSAKP